MNEIEHPKKRAFLAAYEECGTISRACKSAQVSRTNVYNWLADDAEFAEAFEHAKLCFAETLEDEAKRRAVDGIEIPLCNKNGEVVGYKHVYSDTLLIFLLNGALPDKYAQRNKNENHNSGAVNVNVSGKLAGMSDEEIDALLSSASGDGK